MRYRWDPPRSLPSDVRGTVAARGSGHASTAQANCQKSWSAIFGTHARDGESADPRPIESECSRPNQTESADPQPAGMSEEVVDKTPEVIDEAPECPICMSFLCEPITVACGHILCRLCLVQSTRLAPDGRSCPLCRERVNVKDPVTHPVTAEMEAAVKACVPADVYKARQEADLAKLQALKVAADAHLPIFYMYPGAGVGAPAPPVESCCAPTASARCTEPHAGRRGASGGRGGGCSQTSRRGASG